jgi:GDPmannose 4,6-dehydratase
MWRIVQQDESDDYVLATGEAHSVREFVEAAFLHVGIRLDWHGQGVEERGLDAQDGRVLVEVDPRYFRPTEVDFLRGDASKAQAKLGWRHSVSFDDLVREMIEADRAAVAREHNIGPKERR